MAGGAISAYVLLFLVLAVNWFEGGKCAPDYGLDAAISQAKTDPLGSTDSFTTLSPRLKSRLSQLWNHDLSEKRESLLSLRTTHRVTVYLVGFSPNQRAQLRRYLDVLNQDTHVKVIGQEPHQLLVRTGIAFDLELRNDLENQITSAISTYVERMSYTTAATALMSIPHKEVDDIISGYEDHETDSYAVYLLNLGAQKRRYAYSYAEKVSYLRCLGTHWAGARRYMWIDLAAGPVEYGPNMAGEGFVKGGVMPHKGSYTPAQQQTVYLSDLASLLWSAARMLIIPAIRTPVHFEEQTEVHFYHIQGSDMELLNWVDYEDTNATDSEQAKGGKGLNWKRIEGAFHTESRDVVMLAGQTLKFSTFSLQFFSCPLCITAFTRSLKSYTSRILLDRFSLFVHEYLDSKQLHVLLSEYSEEISEQAGVPEVTRDQPPRIIPVYIFDIDSEKQLVLDRFHQVIPFRDMVIAVRSKTGQMVSEYSCNGRPSITQIRELERPLVGALLQTVWGVAPTHVSWSAQHNSTFVDYRWSVGQTPFGPFSEHLSLSFGQSDPARRNVLLTMLNSTVSAALDVLDSVDMQGGEKNLFGSPKKLVEYNQRWNLFVYKLNKAVSAISHFEFDTALFFLKSSEHDLYAFHSAVYTASGQLVATIECFQDPPFPWVWIFLFSGLFTVAVFLWIRRDQIFINKRKMF